MSTIEGAQAFFEDSSQFIYLSPSVTRNMVRIGLNSLVHTSAERLIQEGVSDVTELERRLYELSEVFLGLQIKQVNPQNGMAESNPISGYLSIGKRVESENVTKSIVSSIVKSALDRSKPKMLGWEK